MLRVTSSDDDDVSFVKRLVKDLGMLAEQRPSQGSSVVDITVRRQQQSTDSSDDDDDEESHLAQLRVLKRYSAMPVVQSVQEEAAAESAEFERLRADYYREKLGITDRSGVERLAGFYLQGMQWVMDYYYNGVQSWNWFFPYHYSPRVTDLVPGSRQLFEQMPPFEMGEPFSPFEQLLAVLPARSKILLPEPLRELMFEKVRDSYKNYLL